jgi:hypothetical protein
MIGTLGIGKSFYQLNGYMTVCASDDVASKIEWVAEPAATPKQECCRG